MQRDFRVKHPRLYCRGRNPQNLCSFSDGVFLQVDELHNVASSRPQPRNGGLHDPFPFTKGATLFRIVSVVPKFSSRYGFRRRVWLVYGNFSHSAVFTKLHQGGINRNAGQPSCKLGSSIKILEMNESIQKALLRCIFRVFTVSYDPSSHPGDSFYVTFAKLSEGGSLPTFGGCDQLLLVPRSKIANRCGITLRRKNGTIAALNLLPQ